MAQITIDIQPDNKLSEIANALALANGWTSESPLTKAQFAKKVIAKFVKDTYLHWEAKQAADASYIASQTTNNTVIID